MKLIILAAGKGERLMPFTRNTPKCLLELADGHTLLETQLHAISQCPQINEIILVTGYLSSQIEAKVRTLTHKLQPIRVVYNPFYDKANNLVSLWVGLPFAGDDFVVLNGDDLFKPSVLQGLIAAPPSQKIVMTTSTKPVYDEDDMKVSLTDGLVQRVGKDIPLENASAESIGMIRFLGEGSAWFRQAVETIIRSPEGLNVFWLKAIQAVADSGRPVFTYNCSRQDWREMDFHPDREEIRRHLNAEAFSLPA